VPEGVYKGALLSILQSDTIVDSATDAAEVVERGIVSEIELAIWLKSNIHCNRGTITLLSQDFRKSEWFAFR
jgi:hypothetical protein